MAKRDTEEGWAKGNCKELEFTPEEAEFYYDKRTMDKEKNMIIEIQTKVHLHHRQDFDSQTDSQTEK